MGWWQIIQLSLKDERLVSLGIARLLLTFLVSFAYLEICLESRYFTYATQTGNRRGLRDNNMTYSSYYIRS